MGTIRLLLALAVVVAHTTPFFGIRFFGEGVTAVDSFFLLSGFTMALVLRGRYLEDARAFWINRAVRIFPTYWALLLFAAAASGAYGLLTGRYLGGLGSAFRAAPGVGMGLWAVISNLGIVGTDGLLLAGKPELSLIPQAWSLSVELAFYCVAPWLLRRSVLRPLVAFILAAAARVLFLRQFGTWSIWSYYFFPAVLPYFLAGSLGYFALEWLQARPGLDAPMRRAGWGALLLVAASIGFGRQWGIFPFESLAYFGLFLAAMPLVFTATRDSRIDHLLGDISYPLYMVHAVLISLWPPLRHIVPDSARIYALVPLSLALCYPAMKVDAWARKRFRARPKAHNGIDAPEALPAALSRESRH